MTSFTFPDTSKLVLLAGEALYGDVDDWMARMAGDMGVRPATVSDWANGRRTPSRANIEHLGSLITERITLAGGVVDRIDNALPRMLCPLPDCQAALSVVHAPGERIIQCAGGHFYREKEGAPFGPFVEKEFRQVGETETLAPKATLWLAEIDSRDFPEFLRRVKGLWGPYEAYLEHLGRRVAQWEATPGHVVIRVPVALADLDNYSRPRGGFCTARDMTALAKVTHDSRR